MRVTAVMLVALVGLGQMTDVAEPDAVELHVDEIRELLDKNRKGIEAFPTSADGRNVAAQLSERYGFKSRIAEIRPDVSVTVARSEVDLDTFATLQFGDRAGRMAFWHKRAAEKYPGNFMVLRRKDGTHVLMRFVTDVLPEPRSLPAVSTPGKRPN